ncbi:hypothetical protein BBJ28_00003923 [Nothophytophthora sp. Chile5]|nr:hypothetical protein BBJ28_00003923 [Nothophytophthora sp. Chile5]
MFLPPPAASAAAPLSSSASIPAPAPSRVLSRALPRGRPWHHNADDRLTRKLMMLRLRRLHPVLASTKRTSAGANTAFANSQSGTVVPSLVQRLEWMLYNAAHSMHEYTHEFSLERRVQALVTQLGPKMITQQRQKAEETHGHVCGAKRGISSPEEDVEPSGKRQRVEEIAAVHTQESSSSTMSAFLLENDENLVALVLSFLSGRTVLRLRSVNRFLLLNAPKMVRSLHLETQSPALKHFASGALTTLLLKCTRLTSLVVASKLKPSTVGPAISGSSSARTTRTRMPRPSFNRPSSSDSISRNGIPAGELLLRDIAYAFDRGACPELEELDLGSPLDYFAESDDVLRCLEAFAVGRNDMLRSEQGAKPLTRLRLDSTYLGDDRLNRLAGVFESTASSQGTSCFAALETLVLRNNFIGEAGCQALLRMLRCAPALRRLDLSGNILTDLDAVALADWLDPSPSDDDHLISPFQRVNDGRWHETGAVESRRRADTTSASLSSAFESQSIAESDQLRTLLLQDNFIGQEGLDALAGALKARLRH